MKLECSCADSDYKQESISTLKQQFNPFATGDAYMCQLFHCLQWYAGSERVKDVPLKIFTRVINFVAWKLRGTAALHVQPLGSNLRRPRLHHQGVSASEARHRRLVDLQRHGCLHDECCLLLQRHAKVKMLLRHAGILLVSRGIIHMFYILCPSLGLVQLLQLNFQYFFKFKLEFKCWSGIFIFWDSGI